MQFHLIDGLPGRAREDFGKLTRYFDLSVIEQPVADRNTGDELEVEAAMFRSGRPVLIAPSQFEGPVKFERIVVAWDGGLAAARALGDSLVLLKRAKTVDVVTISSRAPGEAEQGPSIIEHLARHGVKGELKRLSDAGDPAATLLSYGAQAGADFW